MRSYRNMRFLILIILCLMNTSCKMADKIPTVTAPKNAITLTFGYHEAGLPTSGIAQELALDFEKEAGTHIEFMPIPDAQWENLLKAELVEGKAPDIFLADADPYSLYEKIHPDINCIDLSSEEFVSRMDKAVLPAISYEDKVYGITFAGKKIWVYTYNKTIFDELELEIPTNYQELKEVCGKIKEAGITPMWQVPSSGWHQVLPLFETGAYYQTNDPELYEKLNTNQTDITDIPDLLEVIKEINEFSDLGFYGDNYFGNSTDDEVEEFAAGNVAMTLNGIAWSSQLIYEHPEMKGKVGIFIMPWDDSQVIGVNPTSNAYFGNINSLHKEEILEFFRFLARPDNLQKRLDGDPLQFELSWPEIKSRYPEEFTNYLSQFPTGIVMQAGVSYIGSQWMEIGADIEKMYADLMTPQEVMNNISIRREKLAKIGSDPYWK